jgi:hypothetical protein
MKTYGCVKYYKDGVWRIGFIRTMLADFPGNFAVFLIKDIESGCEVVVDSRFMVVV